MTRGVSHSSSWVLSLLGVPQLNDSAPYSQFEFSVLWVISGAVGFSITAEDSGPWGKM